MTQPLNTILDNRDSNTVLAALKRLLPESKSLDVATGYFEIGSLLALDSFWNSLERLRIVMGDETTKRTRNELVESLRQLSEESIEREKEKDDSLTGLAAIRQALMNGLIQTRVFTRAKFHSKAMLMRMKPPHLSNYAIVGSSNFTEPGLCKNVELNLLTAEQNQLQSLQNWYETHWNEAVEVKEELLRVVEPHLKLYSPFEVYAKALYEYFVGKEMPATSWEESQSRIYKMLDQLQKDGYRQALKIAEDWGGALICDGVGFGKTYIALMLIERFLHERKRIALIVPKSTRESVWESRLKQFLNFKKGRGFSSQILVVNHTDLARENPEIVSELQSIEEEADVIIVDEGHHFRTPSAQRSERLYKLIEHDSKKKKVFFLTATPVNNTLFDLLHLMEYFSRKGNDYFQRLAVPNVRKYFVDKEKAVEAKMNVEAGDEEQERIFPDFDVAEAERILKDDKLFNALVIQRSRAYAKNFFEKTGKGEFSFPERQPPIVAEYKLAKVYGELFDSLKTAFNKENPFVDLALYNPESFRRDKEKIRGEVQNRERQVISLIRATLLKRMESSYTAFESSLEDLLRSMARYLRHYASEEWERWKADHESFWKNVEKHWQARFADESEDEVEEDDLLPPPKEEISAEDFFIKDIAMSVRRDMNELANFLESIQKRFEKESDEKLERLIQLLNSEHELKTKKVVIFTQYRDTARYLYREIRNKVPGVVEELDSTSKKDREVVIKRFAPHYNCLPEELPNFLDNQIRVLISTDVLSEGLNLQDANLLINYDLHWNPVRLMQRIGRIDRRLDPAVELKLAREKSVVRFWNFLPPDKLEDLLGLYERVSGKVLRISKTMGIEGKKLLKPEDEYEALRDFNAQYEGVRSIDELMNLKLVEILEKHPELKDKLPRLPKRLFSGKRDDKKLTGIFAAYRFPGRTVQNDHGVERQIPGECRWYFLRSGSDKVIENLEEIDAAIESNEQTPRDVQNSMPHLRERLKIIEQNKVNAELRNMQALAGEKATLVCWIEIS